MKELEKKSNNELQSLKLELKDTPIHLLQFDVQDFKACEQAIQSIPDTFSTVDILLNNAGLALGLDTIDEGNLTHWNTMIDSNIKKRGLL